MTRLEILREALPRDYVHLAQVEVSENPEKVHYLNEESSLGDTPQHILMGLFMWESTTLGFNFWHHVHMQLCDPQKCQLPPITSPEAPSPSVP